MKSLDEKLVSADIKTDHLIIDIAIFSRAVGGSEHAEVS